MLATIRIITFNQNKYIKRCLESVINQKTDFEFEVVIGDDCSTDGTRVIVEQYKIKNSNLIKFDSYTSNIGVFENSKRTLEASSGKYLCFLEGDDYWHDPLKIQKQVDFLENHPEYAMVHSDCDRLVEKTQKVIHAINRKKFGLIPQGQIFEKLLENNFINTCTTCVKREALQKYDDYDFYKKNNFKMADYPRWLAIAQKEKVGYMDESLATYRILPNSSSHSGNFQKQEDFINSILEVKNYYIKKYGCTEQTKLKVEENHWKRLLILAFNSNNYTLADNAYHRLKKLYAINALIRFKYFLYYYATKIQIRKTANIFRNS